jgi:hypothetical protein
LLASDSQKKEIAWANWNNEDNQHFLRVALQLLYRQAYYRRVGDEAVQLSEEECAGRELDKIGFPVFPERYDDEHM